MIENKNGKVNEVIEKIHAGMLNKKERGSRVRDEYVKENRVFLIICRDKDAEPSQIAVKMNELYGCDMTALDVIQLLRSRRMANPVERREIFNWAESVSELFGEAVEGNRALFDKYESLRKKPCLTNGKRHKSQERIAAIMIFEKYPEIDVFQDSKSLQLLGDTLAKYFFYDISDAIREVYGFPCYRDSKHRRMGNSGEKQMTLDEAMQKIEQLNIALERNQEMFEEYQSEFAEQLEESRVKELADFFARLNSEKYGCILDELFVVRKGASELSRSNYELPIQINGMFILVKKLAQFVRDSHIEPIMKINALIKVKASDIEFWTYEGTPFSTPDEQKIVRVISPGWVYKDKDLRISMPKVREEIV